MGSVDVDESERFLHRTREGAEPFRAESRSVRHLGGDDVEVEEKEFISLSPDAIAKLLEERRCSDEAGETHSRRRMPRWPFPGPVQLWCENPLGDEVQVFGTCRNLNEQGIGFFCEQAFDPGTRVTVAIHQPEATYHGDGVVRHCTKSAGEYFVGMEFIGGSSAPPTL